ncbi:MAG: Gfo/Idh/MocA family protein [Acidobacteriota bacterium]
MNRIKLAVVGCGEHSQENILPILWICPEAEVIAVVDSNADNLRRASELIPTARAYTNFVEIFENRELEAVIAAAPPQIHVAVAKMALKQGIHVFLEKPPSVYTRDLLALADLAEARGLITMVGHNIRYSGASLKMKELASVDGFGMPIAMETRYLASKPRGDRWNIGSPLRSFLLSHVSHALDLMLYQVGPCSVNSAQAALIGDGVITITAGLTGAAGAVCSLLAANNCEHFSVHSTLLGESGNYIQMESTNVVTAYGDLMGPKRNGRIWIEQELNTGWRHAGYSTEINAFLSGIRCGAQSAPNFRDEVSVMEAIDEIERRVTETG